MFKTLQKLLRLWLVLPILLFIGIPALAQISPPYGPNGGGGGGIATAILPSGDTTGATDGVAIAAACNAGKNVVLAAGTYYTGASSTAMTLNTVCNITGAGQGLTVIQNEGTTNDVMVVSTSNVPNDATPANPLASGGTFSGFTIIEDAAKTPTAGAGLRVGTNSTTYTFGYTFTNVDIKSTYRGLQADPGFWQNTFRNMIISNPVSFIGVYYDVTSPGGDMYMNNVMLVGADSSHPSNFLFNNSDTTRVNGVKFNNGKFNFTNNFMTNMQVSDTAVEGSVPCAFDFTAVSSGNVAMMKISNVEFENTPLAPYPICHPERVLSLSVSQICEGVATGPAKCFTYPMPGFYLYDDMLGDSGTRLINAESNNLQTWNFTNNSNWNKYLALNGTGKLVIEGGNGIGMDYPSAVCTYGNCTVSVPCTLGASGGGWCQAMGRVTPDSSAMTGYGCLFQQGTGLQLLKWTSGSTDAQIGTTYSGVSSGTHTPALVMSGSSISCTLDGAVVSGPSGTDTAYNTTTVAVALSDGGGVTGYSINGPVIVK